MVVFSCKQNKKKLHRLWGGAVLNKTVLYLNQLISSELKTLSSSSGKHISIRAAIMVERRRRKTVKVIVLGDIGRSPRMQYHALSLANNGFNVKLIGYLHSTPLPDILANKSINITKLCSLEINSGPKLLQYALKAFWQSLSLFLTLLITGCCDYVLCQNPPAIPTLPVCRFYCFITRAKLIIDWHNYAYSIMALSTRNRTLLKVSQWIERYFGQSSHGNLCVTYAMKDDLSLNWNISADVLYDRPPKIFCPLTLQEKHDWFLKIGRQYPEFSFPARYKLNTDRKVRKTAFTQINDDCVEALKDRPGLLFSSTSWTPDEDFGVLMEALQVYEISYDLNKNLPKLVCVITGKGPMKEHYTQQISAKNWQHIKVVTPWLEPEDYPKMVASADLGVCLHYSSSGLDLPMKVVDMFGAGLPVCAFDFKCLGELVENGVNGYTFKSSDELAKQIIRWFEGFPNNVERNNIAQRMRQELVKFQASRWEDNWKLRAKKIFDL